MAVDGAGHVYVTGRSVAGGIYSDAITSSDYATVKYQATPVATVWTGATSTNWFDPANWTGSAPTAPGDAVVPSGTPNAPAIGSGTAAVHDLTLNGGTLAINGVFTNNGGTLA